MGVGGGHKACESTNQVQPKGNSLWGPPKRAEWGGRRASRVRESVHTDIRKPTGHPHSCQLPPAPAFSESPVPEEHQHKERSQLSPSISKLYSEERTGSPTRGLSRVCGKICLHTGASVLCVRRSSLPVTLRVCLPSAVNQMTSLSPGVQQEPHMQPKLQSRQQRE